MSNFDEKTSPRSGEDGFGIPPQKWQLICRYYELLPGKTPEKKEFRWDKLPLPDDWELGARETQILLALAIPAKVLKTISRGLHVIAVWLMDPRTAGAATEFEVIADDRALRAGALESQIRAQDQRITLLTRELNDAHRDLAAHKRLSARAKAAEATVEVFKSDKAKLAAQAEDLRMRIERLRSANEELKAEIAREKNANAVIYGKLQDLKDRHRATMAEQNAVSERNREQHPPIPKESQDVYIRLAELERECDDLRASRRTHRVRADDLDGRLAAVTRERDDLRDELWLLRRGDEIGTRHVNFCGHPVLFADVLRAIAELPRNDRERNHVFDAAWVAEILGQRYGWPDPPHERRWTQFFRELCGGHPTLLCWENYRGFWIGLQPLARKLLHWLDEETSPAVEPGGEVIQLFPKSGT